jgi:hypothetical protein
MRYFDRLQLKTEIADRMRLWEPRIIAMREKGMSTMRFCKKYGLDQPELYNCYTGRRGATLAYCEKIEKYLAMEGV